MSHGKKSHDLYQFVSGSCHLGFDPINPQMDPKLGSIKDSLDMTDLNHLEESKYDRLNDHIVKLKEERNIKFTNVRDNNANK